MIVSAAWIAPAILGGINEIAQSRIAGQGPASWRAVLFVSLDWLLYGALTPGVFALSRRWPIVRPAVRRHAALHVGASLLFCAAWAGGGTVLRAVLQPEALAGGAARHFASWFFITLPFGVAVYLAVVGVEHAIRYFSEARDREVQLARVAEQLSEARFAALRAQLNPHFLFNALNTVAVMVRDGEGASAARIVERLSDVLRRLLSRHRSDLVRLEDELDLVRQYLAIEEARYSDRLRPVFEVDPAVTSAAVPGFALQHLAENAIRHGIARRPDAGVVRVSARRDGDVLELEVFDDGPGVAAGLEPPPGHGLANTRERLRALYGSRASLAVGPAPGGGTVAVIRLPWREIPASEPS